MSLITPTKPGAFADLNRRIAKLGAGKEHLVVLDLFIPLSASEGVPVPEGEMIRRGLMI